MKKLSTELFIERAQEVFGDRFDYSSTKYELMTIKVKITCREHGIFLTYPQTHLKGVVSCGQCNKQAPITKEKFIQEAEKIWSGKFDYSEVIDFNGGRTPITIKCKSHSTVFITTAIEHLRKKNGCVFCQPSGKKFTKKVFLTKVEENSINKDSLYNYSLTPDSFTVQEKITIICIKHGCFQQSAENHLLGKKGCKFCNRNNRLSTTEQFISQSQEIFGNKYDYSKTFLSNGFYGKVSLICREHGEFKYLIKAHLRGLEGCKKCRRKFGPSKGEEELASFIKSCTSFSLLQSDRKVLKGKELDIYIPELKIAFEYNGEYWHSDSFMSKNSGMTAAEYHNMKSRLCEEAGVSLHYIWESEWKNNKIVTEARVKSILNKAEKEFKEKKNSISQVN